MLPYAIDYFRYAAVIIDFLILPLTLRVFCLFSLPICFLLSYAFHADFRCFLLAADTLLIF